jgi:hypothetical protein
VAGVAVGAVLSVLLTPGDLPKWAQAAITGGAAILGAVAVPIVIFMVVLVRAPYRQRDEARAFVDERFRPQIIPPSEKTEVLHNLIKAGELIDDLTRSDSVDLDDVYRRIAEWEVSVNIQLQRIRWPGGPIASGLDNLGSVDMQSLHDYMDERLALLWQGLQPRRMPGSRHPRPERPRLSEPPVDAA